jgi:hypothetical protein
MPAPPARPRQAKEVIEMESIKQWFQDWADACEYANECAPDFSTFPVGNGEPYTAIAAIAVACYLAWAVNEWRLQRRMTQAVAAAPAAGELKVVVAKMQQTQAAPEKLAA